MVLLTEQGDRPTFSGSFQLQISFIIRAMNSVVHV